MRTMSNKENPWHHPLFTALFKFILTPASSLLATTSARPRFMEKTFSVYSCRRVIAYPSYPWRANVSYISLQNLANRLREKLNVGSWLYLPSCWASLFRAAKSFLVTWSKQRCPARSPRTRHRSELTERVWEDAVQGLGKALPEGWLAPGGPRGPT